MLQSIYLLFAPAHGGQVIHPGASVCMATRPEDQHQKLCMEKLKLMLAIAGNALGFTLFLAGLALALRLVEVLLT